MREPPPEHGGDVLRAQKPAALGRRSERHAASELQRGEDPRHQGGAHPGLEEQLAGRRPAQQRQPARDQPARQQIVAGAQQDAQQLRVRERRRAFAEDPIGLGHAAGAVQRACHAAPERAVSKQGSRNGPAVRFGLLRAAPNGRLLRAAGRLDHSVG